MIRLYAVEETDNLMTLKVVLPLEAKYINDINMLMDDANPNSIGYKMPDSLLMYKTPMGSFKTCTTKIPVQPKDITLVPDADAPNMLFVNYHAPRITEDNAIIVGHLSKNSTKDAVIIDLIEHYQSDHHDIEISIAFFQHYFDNKNGTQYSVAKLFITARKDKITVKAFNDFVNNWVKPFQPKDDKSINDGTKYTVDVKIIHNDLSFAQSDFLTKPDTAEHVTKMVGSLLFYWLVAKKAGIIGDINATKSILYNPE